MLLAHEAREELRRIAEGHGRPVITTECQGYRVVAIGNRLAFGRWELFTDFLLSFAKDILGRDWGNALQKRGTYHPFLEWLKLLQENHGAKGPEDARKFFQADAAYAKAIFRFAYALYLIEHHSIIPKRLLKRLRNPATFKPAALETLAFAAFALAGFELEMGEVKAQAGPEGEFSATSSKTRITYHVEAKRKDGWSSRLTEHNSQDFVNELRQWIRQKVYAGARKKLENAIFWLELSLPNLTIDQAKIIQVEVHQALRLCENELLVDGQKPKPAWVIVTVHEFLAADDATGIQCAMLEGFHHKMIESGILTDLEDAMDVRDRDRDILWMLNCLEKVQTVPQTFDGLPDDLIGSNKEPIATIKIGERVEITMPDSKFVRGLVLDIVSQGTEATAIIHDEQNGIRQIVTLPLTEEEQAAARVLGDAAFGKPNSGQRLPESDTLSVYDWLLEVYSKSPREKLESFIEPHPLASEFKKLPTNELCRRVCREWTKSILADQARNKAKEFKGQEK